MAENATTEEQRRVAFKKGQREKHLELLAKNVLLEEELKEKLKKVKSKIKLCVEDLKLGGYVDGVQGELSLNDEDAN